MSSEVGSSEPCAGCLEIISVDRGGCLSAALQAKTRLAGQARFDASIVGTRPIGPNLEPLFATRRQDDPTTAFYVAVIPHKNGRLYFSSGSPVGSPAVGLANDGLQTAAFLGGVAGDKYDLALLARDDATARKVQAYLQPQIKAGEIPGLSPTELQAWGPVFDERMCVAVTRA